MNPPCNRKGKNGNPSPTGWRARGLSQHTSIGSPVVLDHGRSRKQAARFQDLLQQPSHAYLTGRPNAGNARVTTNRKSPLVSMATALSILISDTNGCLTFQRLGLTAVSGQPLQKTPMKSSDVCALSSAFRGSDRFTANVSIRQIHFTTL